jgi:hypothetical protein
LYPDFRRDFWRGRILVLFRPERDPEIGGCIARLTEIQTRHAIRSITVLRIEVPHCNGVGRVVGRVIANSGKASTLREVAVPISGEIL